MGAPKLATWDEFWAHLDSLGGMGQAKRATLAAGLREALPSTVPLLAIRFDAAESVIYALLDRMRTEEAWDVKEGRATEAVEWHPRDLAWGTPTQIAAFRAQRATDLQREICRALAPGRRLKLYEVLKPIGKPARGVGRTSPEGLVREAIAELRKAGRVGYTRGQQVYHLTDEGRAWLTAQEGLLPIAGPLSPGPSGPRSVG